MGKYSHLINEENDEKTKRGGKYSHLIEKGSKELENSPLNNNDSIPLADEFSAIALDTESMISNPYYNFIESRQEGDSLGESLKAGWQGFKDYMSYPVRRSQSRISGEKPPEKPKTWFDFYDDLRDMPKWIEIPSAFGLSLLTDPKDYITLGATGLMDLSKKAGKAVSSTIDEVFETTNDIDKVKTVLKENDIPEGTELFNKIINAKKANKTLSKGETLQEQAKLGQKGLINLNIPFTDVNKPIIKGEKAYKKADDFIDWTKNNPITKDLRKAFIPKPDGISDTAWNIYKQNKHAGKYFARENALNPGYKYRDELDDVLKNTDYKQSDIPDLIENPEKYKQAPDEIKRITVEKHFKPNYDIIKEQREAGFDVNQISNYFPRKMTPEAKKALKENAPDELREIFTDNGVLRLDPHQLSRTPQFENLTTKQINKLNQSGEFEKLFGDYKGKVFVDDPVVAQTYRNLSHQQKMNNARMINKMIDKGIDEGFVVKISEDGKVPEGFVKLRNANDYQPLVEDYAFRRPEAKLLEGEIKRKIPKEFENIENAWDKARQTWKKGNLLFGTSWYGKNAVGNLYRMFQNGFSTPSSLTDSSKIVYKLAKDNPVEGTIKTARGDLKLDEFVEEMKKRGVLDQGLWTDIGQEFGKELNRKGIIKKAEELGFDIHQVEEDITRLAMAMDAAKKGYNLDEAAKISNETLFEYDLLTDFEKKLKNAPWGSPFYTYYRKNIPYQIKKTLTNPKVPNVLRKGRLAMNEAQENEEPEYLPPNIRNNAPLKTPQGTLPLANFLPQYEIYNMINEPLQYAWSKTSPLINIPANAIYGENYFTGAETNLPKSILSSWGPTREGSDLAESIIETMAGNSEESFSDTPQEVAKDLFNPFYTFNPTDEERKILKQMELNELDQKLQELMRNEDSPANEVIPFKDRLNYLLQKYYKNKLDRVQDMN